MTENKPVLEAFLQCEIVSGTIMKADAFPEAHKPAIKLVIDFGPRGVKRSSAQITTIYQPSQLIGMQVVALINVPPRRIAGFDSECLVLGAVGDDGSVVLLTTERPVGNGSKIA